MDINKISDDIALSYWARNDEKSFEEIVNRVASFLTKNSTDLDYFARARKILLNKKFLPNSPCWMNAGTELKSLAACFVLPLEDSMESIFKTARDMALVLKEGGGIGVPLSNLRPTGAQIKKTKGTSSGPVSFLKVFDAIVEAVKSGGTRRGAAMANMRVDHPNIEEFIDCKEKEGDIANFNISVAMTNKFMDAYVNNHSEFVLEHEGIVGSVNPKELVDKIVEGMWRNGEPGIQFIDTVNCSLTDYTKKFIKYNTGIEVSNPCGETFLKPYESCNIGSINLYKYVEPFWKIMNGDGKGFIHTDELQKDMKTIVALMNDMIDLSEAPLDEINNVTKESRKVGIGVMGLADALSALGYKYDSPEGIVKAADIMAMITSMAERESVANDYQNATLTLVAPTGTTGLVGGVSSGIEPHFRLIYDRNSIRLGKFEMMCTSLHDFLSTVNGTYREFILERIRDGSDPLLPSYGINVSQLWPTADKISPMNHLKMLAAIQSNVHNSVSKTINLPQSATREDIKKLLVKAWILGVKGFTVYRDKSRQEQVIMEKEDKPKPRIEMNPGLQQAIEEAADEVIDDMLNSKHDKEYKILADRMTKEQDEEFVKEYIDIVNSKRNRPFRTVGMTDKLKIGCGNLYVTVNSDDNGICEVFTNLGRSGGCPSQSEATSRLISLALRSGVSIEEIIDQLKGIRCLSTVAGNRAGRHPNGKMVLSCPDAIGKCLEEALKSNKVKVTHPEVEEITATLLNSSGLCPECTEKLSFSEGCRMCTSCGWSKCG